MTLEHVFFFKKNVKSVLMQLGHYLAMRTSNQDIQFQKYNGESIIFFKKTYKKHEKHRFQRRKGQYYLLKTCFYDYKCS